MKPLVPDVISIQSQVVYGAVGNTAAVPVLQAHGLVVAQVPSIILSSTPHYQPLYGGPVPSDWFRGWLDSLFDRDAIRGVKAVQIGYLGEREQTDILFDWLERVLEVNDDQLLVVMDPVLGDADSGLYTQPGIDEGWRRLISLASGLTPNAFELGVLAGQSVDTIEGVYDAARSLLGRRTRWVAATSAAPAEWQPGEMMTALRTESGAQAISHKRVKSAVKGTGDMFSAGVTAGLLAGLELAESISRAGQTVTAALTETIAAGSEELMLRLPHR